MHSPAPFKISAPRRDEKNGGEFRVIKSADGGWIADVRSNSGEEDLNCALFMAAPDLLVVAKQVIDFYGGLGAETDSPLHRMAIAAVQRAEGGAT